MMGARHSLFVALLSAAHDFQILASIPWDETRTPLTTGSQLEDVGFPDVNLHEHIGVILYSLYRAGPRSSSALNTAIGRLEDQHLSAPTEGQEDQDSSVAMLEFPLPLSADDASDIAAKCGFPHDNWRYACPLNAKQADCEMNLPGINYGQKGVGQQDCFQKCSVEPTCRQAAYQKSTGACLPMKLTSTVEGGTNPDFVSIRCNTPMAEVAKRIFNPLNALKDWGNRIYSYVRQIVDPLALVQDAALTYQRPVTIGLQSEFASRVFLFSKMASRFYVMKMHREPLKNLNAYKNWMTRALPMLQFNTFMIDLMAIESFWKRVYFSIAPMNRWLVFKNIMLMYILTNQQKSLKVVKRTFERDVMPKSLSADDAMIRNNVQRKLKIMDRLQKVTFFRAALDYRARVFQWHFNIPFTFHKLWLKARWEVGFNRAKLYELHYATLLVEEQKRKGEVEGPPNPEIAPLPLAPGSYGNTPAGMPPAGGLPKASPLTTVATSLQDQQGQQGLQQPPETAAEATGQQGNLAEAGAQQQAPPAETASTQQQASPGEQPHVAGQAQQAAEQPAPRTPKGAEETEQHVQTVEDNNEEEENNTPTDQAKAKGSGEQQQEQHTKPTETDLQRGLMDCGKTSMDQVQAKLKSYEPKLGADFVKEVTERTLKFTKEQAAVKGNEQHAVTVLCQAVNQITSGDAGKQDLAREIGNMLHKKDVGHFKHEVSSEMERLIAHDLERNLSQQAASFLELQDVNQLPGSQPVPGGVGVSREYYSLKEMSANGWPPSYGLFIKRGMTPPFSTYGTYSRVGAFMMGVDMRWFDPTTSGPGMTTLAPKMGVDIPTSNTEKTITMKAAYNAQMAYLEYGAFPCNIMDAVLNFRIRSQVWLMDLAIFFGVREYLDVVKDMEGRSEEHQALSDLLLKLTLTEGFLRVLALYHLTLRVHLAGTLHKIQRQYMKISKAKRTDDKAAQEQHTKELWMTLWPFYAAKMNQKHILENLISVAAQVRIEFARRLFQWTYNAFLNYESGAVVTPLDEILLVFTAKATDDNPGMWDD